MTVAKITATNDIPEAVLIELTSSLADFDIEIDNARYFQHSLEPPSWISLVAQSDWWIKGLAAYAALYIAELVKEAAKESWRNRGNAVSAVVEGGNKLWRLATALFAAETKAHPSTYIAIDLQTPSDACTMRLRCKATNADDLTLEIALFVHHLPALVELLEQHGLPERAEVGWVGVEILDNGSLQVTWMSQGTQKEVRCILPLRS